MTPADLIARVRAATPYDRALMSGSERAWYDRAVALCDALEEALKEIAIDDELLATRKAFIEEIASILGGCEAHGDDCMPHLVEAARRLTGKEPSK